MDEVTVTIINGTSTNVKQSKAKTRFRIFFPKNAQYKDVSTRTILQCKTNCCFEVQHSTTQPAVRTTNLIANPSNFSEALSAIVLVEFLHNSSIPANSWQDPASIDIQWSQPIECQCWQDPARNWQELTNYAKTRLSAIPKPLGGHC